MNPRHPTQTAPQLVDVIVFACGRCNALSPLAASSTAKAMLPICNRPMIWYCLLPWIQAGFSRFFICVDEDYAPVESYLRSTFAGAPCDYQFFFVVVHRSDPTTSDGVNAFLQYKERLRRDDEACNTDDGQGNSPASQTRQHGSSPITQEEKCVLQEHTTVALGPRDAFLVHVDTVVANVDIELFVKSFYLSMSSVLMMLTKPLESTTSSYAIAQAECKAAEASSKGSGGKGAAASHPAKQREVQFPSFQYNYSNVVYEEEGEHYRRLYENRGVGDEDNQPSGFVREACATRGPESIFHSPLSGAFTDEESEQIPEVPPHHHRLHYIMLSKPDAKPKPLTVSLPYAARRPRLVFERGVVNPQVCLVRHWVLEYIASLCEEDVPSMSVEEDILPLLARSQHALINVSKRVLVPPEKKLDFPIPVHWFFSGEGRQKVKSLNAGNNEFIPEHTDNLLVGAVVYEEHPMSNRRIYKLNTKQNYVSANQEVMACRALRSSSAALGADGRPSGIRLVSPDDSNPSTPLQNALSDLLPDSSVFLLEKDGSQGLYVRHAFLRSVVPPNTYITRSSIGADVKIAPGVRITDCVIMRGVEIHAGAVLSRSAVGEASSIAEGVKLMNSVCDPHSLVEEDMSDKGWEGPEDEVNDKKG